MRLYKVSLDGDFGDADGRSYWTASKAGIAKLRKRLVQECNDPSRGRGSVVVETLDLGSRKGDLLEFLNTHADRGESRNFRVD